MDWAFRQFRGRHAVQLPATLWSRPVWLGTEPTVPLVGGHDLMVTMPRNWRRRRSVKVAYDLPLRPGGEGRHAGQADGDRAGRAASGCAAAGGRGCATARLARARDRGAVALRHRYVSRNRSRAVSSRSKAGRAPASPPSPRLLAEALARPGLPVLRTRNRRRTWRGAVARRCWTAGSIGRRGPRRCCISPLERSMWRRLSSRHWMPAPGWCATVSDSTLAYQGYGQGADRTFIAEQIRLLGMAPDLTLVLDVPESVASRPDAAAWRGRRPLRAPGCGVSCPRATGFPRDRRHGTSAASCWTLRAIFGPSTPPS